MSLETILKEKQNELLSVTDRLDEIRATMTPVEYIRYISSVTAQLEVITEILNKA